MMQKIPKAIPISDKALLSLLLFSSWSDILKLFQNIDKDFSILKSNKVECADSFFGINGKLLVQQLHGQVRYTYVKHISNPVIQ